MSAWRGSLASILGADKYTWSPFCCYLGPRDRTIEGQIRARLTTILATPHERTNPSLYQ